jgi:hypothetical protein
MAIGMAKPTAIRAERPASAATGHMLSGAGGELRQMKWQWQHRVMQKSHYFSLQCCLGF